VTEPVRCPCGAALPDGLDWCPRCYTPRTSTEAPHDSPAAGVPGRPDSPITPRRPASGLRRWDASPVTFALPGRIIATILCTLPLLWFLYFLVPFGLVGVIIYGGLIYPRALRDIWVRADRL